MHAIYEGRISHTRLKPKAHKFSYAIRLLFIDLDNIQHAFKDSFFWSFNKPNLACFLRKDYFGNKKDNLKNSIIKLLTKRLGILSIRKVFLLTNARYFGYCFNPVSFYYCYDQNKKLEAIVTHITNTPWNENYAYVHDCRKQTKTIKRFKLKKNFHVSPFMPMNIQYEWSFNEPSDQIMIDMNNLQKKSFIFNVHLSLTRLEMNKQNLNKILFTFPSETFKTILAIYWNALLLRLKNIPFYSHPNKIAR